MADKSKYIKMKKIGYSISYKDVYKDYKGKSLPKGTNYKEETIAGYKLEELKGKWWIVPDERIYDDDFKNAKSSTLSVFVSVHGHGDIEKVSGKLNSKSNTAYITQRTFESLL
ncbi:MAG: hypothetical protein ACFFG0_54480 [Candidatus Thorarchaeota archaeon]